jgi:hypothetical protein
MKRALNLLNYPSLARQKRIFQRCWSGLAGLLLGGSLAWAWHQWQEVQTARLRQEQSHLQAALDVRTQQVKEAGHQQTRSRLQAEQLGQLKQIVQHQQAWGSLHDALRQEAQEGGLRLQRLQAQAEKIELQGTMTRFEAMSETRQNLSDQLVQTFGLASITVGPGEEVGFVWQATWPAANGALKTPRSLTAESKP